MANESKGIFRKDEEEQKLVDFYKNILADKSDPSQSSQKKFLLQLLNTKIAQVEPQTIRIKHIHYWIRISVMLLSAISTVILGLKINDLQNWPDISSNAALIITAIVTFLSGLAVFWDTENYWIRNKIMLNKLKEIRYEFVFYLEDAKSPEPEEMKKFLNKFLSALGDEYWEKFLQNISEEDKN